MASKDKRSGPDPLTDLLRATARGDLDAFHRLYDMTSPRLFAVPLRILRRRDWAEDVLQEVYLRIWDHAADYRPEKGTPMMWMAAIARNRALDWRRRERNDAPLDESEQRDALAEPQRDPLDWAIAGEEARALNACLDRLEPDQRKCLALAYFEGYTHEELARHLARPLGTVKSWIRRGLARVKECIETWRTSSTT